MRKLAWVDTIALSAAASALLRLWRDCRFSAKGDAHT
jgi:hypothetical protein